MVKLYINSVVNCIGDCWCWFVDVDFGDVFGVKWFGGVGLNIFGLVGIE